ncbi:MAG TPA: acetyl-CoA C-acyltransferase [Ramlibacter sp.]|nr:acetyl-CoA C-acyltransferase [Ramlibacter sp.]
MSASPALIAAWARSAVAPRGGAFALLQAHQIAAPVVQALLQRAGIAPKAVDALVLGNALGAGGNPARMVALAAGLPEACAALSVDTQCCSGIDALAVAAGLIASGQAQVVVAGGVEAWSRSPIRLHRPLREGEPAVAYERPAFVPDAARDPDMLESAANYAQRHGYSRAQQDAYAVQSHQRALAAQAMLAAEIVPVAGVANDLYPRAVTAARAARMPVVAGSAGAIGEAPDCSLGTLGVSAMADGAAFVLVASAQACEQWGLAPRARLRAAASVGANPETPLLAAELAARAALQRGGLAGLGEVDVVELHDAFAVQGLSFCQALGVDVGRINSGGGGLARGHPIGASAAIALVRVLAELARGERSGATGLAAVAGAGGIGAAALVEWL